MSTAASTTYSNQRSSSSSEDEKARKRASVAAASRKLRMKRKLEKTELKNRNEELEEEQKNFNKTIADLQLEIQTLRGTSCSFGKSDLKLENLLLRAEVKRHKTLVNHLRYLTNYFPEYEFSAKDKVEITKNVVESAIGQMLGLLYTSIMDQSGWGVVEYYCKHLKNIEDCKFVCRYLAV